MDKPGPTEPPKDDQWQDVQSIFARICDLPDKERESRLRDACRGDDSLREEVRSLLHYHDQSSRFLEDSPLNEVVRAMVQEKKPKPPALESPNRFIGPYQIHELLGKGGMGSVYVAHQLEPVRRKVALKIVNVGMDDSELLARFQYEYQALAMMNHSNIAHVYDAGTTEDGRPYFTMEYLSGETIIQSCDRRSLPLRARLELFLQVCDGVQHAHRKGIIHRDLKPSNIVVIEEDSNTVPKIIDFGIAKVLNQSRDYKKTTFGTLMGTPAYMSPEQADCLDVDTATDVYALGIILYEMLTGHLPFDGEIYRHASLGEVLKTVREKEAVRPSDRLIAMGTKAVAVAEQRSMGLRTLIRNIRGDLDLIVLKSIEKDRDNRYQSVSDLAADLQRFLNCEPVMATPPSTMYLLKKYVRRHKTRVTLALAVVFSLVLGLMGLFIGLLKAREEAEENKHMYEIISGIVTGVNPHGDNLNESFLEVLDKTASSLDGQRLKDENMIRIRLALSTSYQSRSKNDRALDQCLKANELLEKGNVRDIKTVLEVRNRLGSLLIERNDFQEATRVFEDLLTRYENRPGSFGKELSISMAGLARAFKNLTRYEEAETLLKRAVAIQSSELGHDHQITMVTTIRYALLLREMGQFEKAERLLEGTAALQEKLFAGNLTRPTAAWVNLVLIKMSLGKVIEAGELAEKAWRILVLKFGPNHDKTLDAQINYSFALLKTGLVTEADHELFASAVDFNYQREGSDLRPLLTALNNLASFYLKLGYLVEAETIKDEELFLARVSENHQDLQSFGRQLDVTLGEIYLKQGRLNEAETLFCQIIETLAPERRNAGTISLAKGYLAVGYARQGRCEDAVLLLCESEKEAAKDSPEQWCEIHLELRKHCGL